MVELVNNSLFTWQQSDPIVLFAAKHRHTVQYSRTWCDTLSARLDFRSIPLKRRKTKYAHVKNVDGSRLPPQQSVCFCRWPDHGYNQFLYVSHFKFPTQLLCCDFDLCAEFECYGFQRLYHFLCYWIHTSDRISVYCVLSVPIAWNIIFLHLDIYKI